MKLLHPLLHHLLLLRAVKSIPQNDAAIFMALFIRDGGPLPKSAHQSWALRRSNQPSWQQKLFSSLSSLPLSPLSSPLLPSPPLSYNNHESFIKPTNRREFTMRPWCEMAQTIHTRGNPPR
ncbi:hypothetical protein M758_3G192500, partial [Ceratodon purpureus]